MRGFCIVPLSKFSFPCQVHYFFFLDDLPWHIQSDLSLQLSIKDNPSGGPELAADVIPCLIPSPLFLSHCHLPHRLFGIIRTELIVTFISFYINHHRKLRSPGYSSFPRFWFPDCSIIPFLPIFSSSIAPETFLLWSLELTIPSNCSLSIPTTFLF